MTIMKRGGGKNRIKTIGELRSRTTILFKMREPEEIIERVRHVARKEE